MAREHAWEGATPAGTYTVHGRRSAGCCASSPTAGARMTLRRRSESSCPPSRRRTSASCSPTSPIAFLAVLALHRRPACRRNARPRRTARSDPRDRTLAARAPCRARRAPPRRSDRGAAPPGRSGVRYAYTTPRSPACRHTCPRARPDMWRRLQNCRNRGISRATRAALRHADARVRRLLPSGGGRSVPATRPCQLVSEPRAAARRRAGAAYPKRYVIANVRSRAARDGTPWCTARPAGHRQPGCGRPAGRDRCCVSDGLDETPDAAGNCAWRRTGCFLAAPAPTTCRLCRRARAWRAAAPSTAVLSTAPNRGLRRHGRRGRSRPSARAAVRARPDAARWLRLLLPHLARAGAYEKKPHATWSGATRA